MLQPMIGRINDLHFSLENADMPRSLSLQNLKHSHLLPPLTIDLCISCSWRARSLSSLLAANPTIYPSFDKISANSSPIPELAPTTIAFLKSSSP